MSKLYGLYLNMMRDRKERIDLVAVADSAEKLKAWAEDQRAAEEYRDGSTSAYGGLLRKTYKPGSDLEYYNPPESWEVESCDVVRFHGGVAELPSRDEWVRMAGEQWDRNIAGKKVGL